MKEAFDKHIEQELKHFQIQPSPMVWVEIEKSLHPENKRRIVPFWWIGIGFLVLTIGGLGLLYINNTSDKTLVEKPNADNNIVLKESTTQKLSSKVNDKENIIQQLQNTKASTKPSLHNQIAQKSSLKIKNQYANNKYSSSLKTKASSFTEKNSLLIEEDKEAVSDVKPSIPASINNTNYKNFDGFTQDAATKSITDSAFTGIQNSKQQEEIPSKNTVLDSVTSDAKQTTIADNIVVNKVPPKKRWEWNFGAGILSISEGLFSSGAKSITANSSLSLGGGVINNSNTRNTFVNQPRGMHISVGISKHQTLKKNWSYFLGLQYRYIQTKQVLQPDTLPFTNNRFLTQTNINNNVSHTNFAHLFEVPFGIEHIITPKQKHPLTISTSMILSWSFHKEWLVTSNGHEYFYKNPSLTQSILVQANAGLFYQLNHQSKIGFVAQRSFTPIHKQVQPQLYFTQYAIQFRKQFSFNSKRK
ncbi:MAG: hypothetical protein ACOVNY_05290 [Chitinophagaceae bacterium]